jgi:hypothetical protein
MNPTDMRRRIAAGLTLSLAVFALVAPTAFAKPVPGRDWPGDRLESTSSAPTVYVEGRGQVSVAELGAQTPSEIPYLSHGVGVTQPAPTEPVFVGRFDGKPDGYQPVKFEPVVITETVASGSGVQWDEMAYGLALGIGLALLAAAMTLITRRRLEHA